MVKAASKQNLNLTLLHLCLAEMPEDVLSTPGLLKEPSLERQNALCLDIAGRLKSRCLGLLESSVDDSWADESVQPTNRVVSFIHKSVYDFLETDAAQSRISACPGQDTFYPEVAVLKAYILQLKTLPGRGKSQFTRKDWFRWLRPSICHCIELALASERASGLSNVEHLKRLSTVADEIWESVDPRTDDEGNGSTHWVFAHDKYDVNKLPLLDPFIHHYVEYASNGRTRKALAHIPLFDELCQKKGLDLYAAAVDMPPRAWPADECMWSYGPRDNDDQPLAAAVEISNDGPQARQLLASTQSPPVVTTTNYDGGELEESGATARHITRSLKRSGNNHNCLGDFDQITSIRASPRRKFSSFSAAPKRRRRRHAR